MNLIELMTASSIFMAASAGSLQLWAASATASQQGAERQQVLERMDLHWLHLQARWRRDAKQWSALSCAAAVSRLEALAATTPIPPGLMRDLEPSAEDTALVVTLSSSQVGQADGLRRQRLFTAAAFGPCSQAGLVP
jgi:hypothetical protein